MLADNFGRRVSNGSCYHAWLDGYNPKKFKMILLIFERFILLSKCIKALINKKDKRQLLLNGGLIPILCV